MNARGFPVCVLSCTAGALHSGPGRPQQRGISTDEEHTTARLQEELGTDPSVYFILPDTAV